MLKGVGGFLSSGEEAQANSFLFFVDIACPGENKKTCDSFLFSSSDLFQWLIHL